MINLSKLEDLISISKAFWAFDVDGMICDLEAADYIDVGGEEYRRVADNKYQLIT